MQDLNVLDAIHRDLDKRDLLPSQHLVDTGYVSAARLSNSQQDYAVDVVGPVHPDVSWQARTEGAYDTSHFRLDWEHFQAICPQGKVSQYWAFKVGSDDTVVR